MTIEITKEKMLLDINNYLTGQLESMTCSCETSLEPNSHYREAKNWINKNGEKRELYLPGHVYIQGYNNYGTSKTISWFEDAARKGNPTFLERFWKYIKNMD